ncbi:MAG: biopolymer transporter ExbD, partial [Planctomycetota bacterium]|nr:biopolymer transporter ExbD [Planctomycetota bacterium]
PREAGDQSARTEPAGLIVNLLADGTIVEGDEPISLDRLRILALSTSSTPGDERRPRPLIRADRNAPAERLNQIMNVLRQSGLSGIRLATSPNS